jgi:hypothetical protein
LLLNDPIFFAFAAFDIGHLLLGIYIYLPSLAKPLCEIVEIPDPDWGELSSAAGRIELTPTQGWW